MTRFFSGPFFVVLLSVVWTGQALAGSPAAQPDTNAQVVKELQQVNAQLAKLNKRVDKLQKKLDKLSAANGGDAGNGAGAAPQAVGGMGPWPGQGQNPNMHGPDYAVLNKIKLPAKPNHKQVMRYIQKIAQATQNQNSFSYSSDPQVGMLKKVGQKHLSELIDSLGAKGGMFNGNNLDYYLVPAITQLATDKNKKLVVDNLASHQGLIQVIMRHGWVDDAKKTLIEGLKRNPGNMPDKWVRAVASFSDKSTYPALKQCLITSQQPTQIFQVIRYLPHIDLSDAVDRMWRRALVSGQQWQMSDAAEVAVCYGHVRALGTLIRELNKPQQQQMGDAGEIRSLVMQYVDKQGTNKQLGAWFDKHHSDIRFNEKTKKYYVTSGLS